MLTPAQIRRLIRRRKASAAIVADYAGSGSSSLTYVDIPAAPAFSSTHLITDADGSSLESGELSGSTDILVQNPFNQRLRPNGLVGSSGTPYRFKSESDSTRSWIGGSVLTTGQQVVTNLNGSNYCYFYHLGIAGDPVYAGATGITGYAWQLPSSGDSFIVLNDLVVKDVSFAGVQLQATSATQDYADVDIRFCRIFGHPEEGEGFYLGNTGTSGYAKIDALNLYHCFVTDKGRDGFQFNNVGDLDAQQLTCYDVGKVNDPGQNRLIQVQNCNGVIKNCVFDKAPELFDVFAHGLTFENCYFRWDTDDDGFIGKLTSQYTGSPYETNTAVNFIDCIFDPSVTQTSPLISISEDECDINFTRCLKGPNASGVALYFDNRTDKATYSITETGTGTYSGGVPTFQSVAVGDESTHGLLTNTTLHGLGMGYRTQAVS